MSRLTQREWRAVAEAIGFRLAGEMEEGTDVEALQSAREKVWDRLPESDKP